MATAIDIGILAVIALFLMVGYSKGVFTTLMKTAAVILSYVGARLAASYAGPVLADSFLKPELTYRISKALFGGSQTAPLPTKPYEHISSVMKTIGINTRIAQEVTETVGREVSVESESFVSVVSEAIANTLAQAAVSAAVFVILFLITLAFVDMVTNVFQLPILGRIDRVCGAVVGAGFGVITVMAICIAFSCLWPFVTMVLPSLPSVAELTGESAVFSFFINNNLLIKLAVS